MPEIKKTAEEQFIETLLDMLAVYDDIKKKASNEQS